MQQSKLLTHAARIWTFDGGGPSVISQLLIVNEIMLQIQSILELEEAPKPCDYADLMVGSGLGAVVVILLARLRLTAREALDHLIKLGQESFVEPAEPTKGHKFDVKQLGKATKELLSNFGLDEKTKLVEKVIPGRETYAALATVPTSDLSTCRLLRTYMKSDADRNCTVFEAVQASMAIPGWFPAATIGSGIHSEDLIGGSIGFNNPTKKALEEAEKLFGQEQQVSVILSFGAGQQSTHSFDKQSTEGLQEALSAMTLEGRSVTDDLAERFAGTTFYHRFSVDSINSSLDGTGWSQDLLGKINGSTKAYMRRTASSLASVAETLVENKGSHALGQLTHVKTKKAIAKAVPRLTPYYIPRDEVSEYMSQCLLEDSFDGQKIFVIYGMGGVGKTQLSSYFERKNRSRYKYVFFIDASSTESIEADLQAAIRSLGGMYSQDTYEDTLQFLAHPDNQDWLIIFDNADDPDLPLTTYMPECDHGTTVITGRNHALAQLAPTSHWHLEGMADPISMQVLLKAAQRKTAGKPQDLKAATDLIHLLGGLPLALVQVGCYCNAAKVPFASYLERFQKHRSKLMEMKPALGVDKYNYSTYTSIRMSYSLLDRGARALLHLLAFFHHSSICLESIRVASKYGYRGPEWDVVPREGQYRKHLTTLQKLLTPDGSWSDFNMDDLLNQAQSFSLISLNDASEHTSASIHPLTQSCILDTLSSEEFNLYFHMAALVLSTCSRDEEIPLFQYLTMHIAELESRKVDIHPTDMASFSYILYRGGQYEASLKRWEMVAEGSKKVNGEEHSSTLQALYRMADCLHFLDRSDEAEELSRSVTKTQERVLGLSDDRTINSYELLAEILTLKGKTKEAEDHLQKALVSNRNKYGEDHWRTFDIQSLLAANLFYQMRYTDGEQILKDILEPMKEALGEDDLITLYTLSTLSRGLMDHEKWDEAQTILDDLVEKRTRIYGSHHPFTLNSLYSSAICRSERGMFDEAKTIFSDILELQERSLGNDHADTIETRKALERIAGREELSKTTGSPNSTRLHMSLSPDFKPTSSFFQLEKSPVSLRSHGNGAPGQPARS